MNRIYKTTIPVVLTLILALASSALGTEGVNSNDDSAISSEKVPIPYRINDAHLHYVDFLQNTDGMKVLLEAMDDSGVEHIMLNGLPLVKKWDAIDPPKLLYCLADDSRTTGTVPSVFW